MLGFSVILGTLAMDFEMVPEALNVSKLTRVSSPSDVRCAA